MRKTPEPTATDYFFAENWPFKLWLAIGTGGTVVFAVTQTEIGLGAWRDWQTLRALMVVLALSAPIGYFASFIAAKLILAPFYEARIRLNGGPFQPGDRVLVLVKPFRGRVSSIYGSWQHGALRVELGEDAKRKYRDIFHASQLLRVSDAELPDATAVEGAGQDYADDSEERG